MSLLTSFDEHSSDSEYSNEESDTLADSETQEVIWQSIQSANEIKKNQIKMKKDLLKAIQASDNKSNSIIFCNSTSNHYQTWPYNQ